MTGTDVAAPVGPGKQSGRAWALLLTGQVFSTLGTQITAVVIPAVAVLAFGSGIGSATLLLVAEFLPGALLGPLGEMLDRVRLRTVLVCLDLVRALAMMTTAAAIVAGIHSIWLLYALAGVLGIASAVFDSGAETVIPSLVASSNLDKANAARASLLNLVRIGGPGLGGLITAVSSASATVAITGCTFIASAGLVATVQAPGLRQHGYARTHGRGTVVQQLHEAVRYLRGDFVLRRSVLGTATLNVAGSGIGALFFVYTYQQLHLNPGQVGLTISAFSVGAVLGATFSSWLVRRFTAGRACAMSASVASVALFLIPAASWGHPVELLATYQVLFGAAATAWATILLSLRQRRTAAALLGRVSALMNAVTIATVPLGAVVGTLLAALLGLTPTFIVLAAIALPTSALYWGSRFRRADTPSVREVPA